MIVMDKKKLIFIVAILVIVGVIVYFVVNNVSITKPDDFDNYTPEQEISDEQLRQASITLYFLDKETNELKSQNKMIDSNELLKNPYKTIVQKLLEGPSSDSFGW